MIIEIIIPITTGDMITVELVKRLSIYNTRQYNLLKNHIYICNDLDDSAYLIDKHCKDDDMKRNAMYISYRSFIILPTSYYLMKCNDYKFIKKYSELIRPNDFYESDRFGVPYIFYIIKNDNLPIFLLSIKLGYNPKKLIETGIGKVNALEIAAYSNAIVIAKYLLRRARYTSVSLLQCISSPYYSDEMFDIMYPKALILAGDRYTNNNAFHIAGMANNQRALKKLCDKTPYYTYMLMITNNKGQNVADLWSHDYVMPSFFKSANYSWIDPSRTMSYTQSYTQSRTKSYTQSYTQSRTKSYTQSRTMSKTQSYTQSKSQDQNRLRRSQSQDQNRLRRSQSQDQIQLPAERIAPEKIFNLRYPKIIKFVTEKGLEYDRGNVLRAMVDDNEELVKAYSDWNIILKYNITILHYAPHFKIKRKWIEYIIHGLEKNGITDPLNMRHKLSLETPLFNAARYNKEMYHWMVELGACKNIKSRGRVFTAQDILNIKHKT